MVTISCIMWVANMALACMENNGAWVVNCGAACIITATLVSHLV